MTQSSLARIFVATLGLLLFCCSATTSFSEAEDVDSDIDRHLLDALDAADDELKNDKPKNLLDKPREKKDKDSDPAARPGRVKPHDPLDQQLREQLEAGEDIPLGLDEDEVSALGEDADPITKIGEKMRLVERLLVKETAQQRTRKLQEEIVRDLAELLKQLQQQQQQQQASSANSKSQSRQQAQRNKVQQPKTGSGRKQGSQPGRASEKPAQDSDQQLRKAEQKPIDVVEVTEIIKREWGHLPEKDRDEIYRQLGNTEALPESAISIEKYFRRLSEADEE